MSLASRILVIDDDLPVLELLCEELREFGHEVVGASSGREGLRRVVEDAPDLVLLDLRMPGVDGQHVLGRLRVLAPAIPVIVVTGVDDPEVARETLAAGAVHCLTKPIDLNRLGAIVAATLSRRA